MGVNAEYMGVEGKAVRMSAGELGCTYAALILHDDGLEVNEENIKKLITAAKVECDSYWPGLFAKYLAGNMDELICSPGGGGSAAVAVAGAASGGGAAAEEAKEESSEEDDDAGAMAGGGLFDDGGDDY